jgi:hypothetical protein
VVTLFLFFLISPYKTNKKTEEDDAQHDMLGGVPTKINILAQSHSIPPPPPPPPPLLFRSKTASFGGLWN